MLWMTFVCGIEVAFDIKQVGFISLLPETSRLQSAVYSEWKRFCLTLHCCWIHWEKKLSHGVRWISWHLHSSANRQNCSHINRAAKHIKISCLPGESSLNHSWLWWILPQVMIRDIHISPRSSCPWFLAEWDYCQPRPQGSLLSCAGNRDPWSGPTTFRIWMAL